MYRSEVISVLYEQNFISFYINTLGPFSRALSQLIITLVHYVDSRLEIDTVFTGHLVQGLSGEVIQGLNGDIVQGLNHNYVLFLVP